MIRKSVLFEVKESTSLFARWISGSDHLVSPDHIPPFRNPLAAQGFVSAGAGFASSLWTNHFPCEGGGKRIKIVKEELGWSGCLLNKYTTYFPSAGSQSLIAVRETEQRCCISGEPGCAPQVQIWKVATCIHEPGIFVDRSNTVTAKIDPNEWECSFAFLNVITD